MPTLWGGHSPYTKGNFEFERVWLVGEVPLQYLTGALRGNMFMTDGPINQGGQGSAVERRLQHASEQYAIPEAMQRLSREFDLSERQAYRYLEEATHLKRPVEVTEATVPITLKVPEGTARLLRAYSKSTGLTIGAIVTRALAAFLSTQRRHG
jgi:hypothetical protein